MAKIFFGLSYPDGYTLDPALEVYFTRALEEAAARLGVPLAVPSDEASGFVVGRRSWLLAYVAACSRVGPVGFGHIRPWSELFGSWQNSDVAASVLAAAFDLHPRPASDAPGVMAAAARPAIAERLGTTPEMLRRWLAMRSAPAAGGMLADLVAGGCLSKLGMAPTASLDGWPQQRARACSYYVPTLEGLEEVARMEPALVACAEAAAAAVAPRVSWQVSASPAIETVRRAWSRWLALDSNALREGLAAARVTDVAVVRGARQVDAMTREHGTARPRAGVLPADMLADGLPVLAAPVSRTIGHASRDGSMDATDDDAPPAPVRTAGRGSGAGAGAAPSSRPVSARYRPTW